MLLKDVPDLRLLVDSSHTFIHERLELYVSELISVTRHHPQLDSALLTVRCRQDTIALARAWRGLFGPIQNRLDHMMDVTDEDVRKVFMRTVQHRVRVLEGPRHETVASLIFTASGLPAYEAEWEGGRRRVGEILKEIIESLVL